MYVIRYPLKKVVLHSWKLETDGKSVSLLHKGKIIHVFDNYKNIRTAIFIHLFYSANILCSYEDIYKSIYSNRYPPVGQRAKVNQRIQRQANHLKVELKDLPLEIEINRGVKLIVDDDHKTIYLR